MSLCFIMFMMGYGWDDILIFPLPDGRLVVVLKSWSSVTSGLLDAHLRNAFAISIYIFYSNQRLTSCGIFGRRIKLIYYMLGRNQYPVRILLVHVP